MFQALLFSLLPDIIHVIELAYKAKDGPTKQTMALDTLNKTVTAMGAPPLWEAALITTAQNLIPILVDYYNGDPANTLFTKEVSSGPEK